MKKLFYLLASVLCLAMLACGEKKPVDDPGTDPGTDPGKDPVTPVAVTAVNLSQRTAELWVGDRLRLGATVKPDNAADKTVSWATSDSALASIEEIESGANDAAIIVTSLAAGDVTITAKAGDITASCQITIHPVETPPYVFSLDPTSVTLPAEGGEFTITVTCTGGYHMQSAPEWIISASADGNKYTFTAGANEATEERKGVIVFCDDVGTCLPVQVKQEAAEEKPYDGPFTLSPTQVEIPAEGGEFQVEVLCSGGYHVNSMPEWVSEVSVTKRVHTFSVGANESTEERKGVLVFCDDVGTCLPCMVKQAGNPSTSAGAGTEDVYDGTPVNW